MNIPFKVKLLTDTAKAPAKENQGDLWDIYADDFSFNHLKDRNFTMYKSADGKYVDLCPMGRVLVKTGISLELPKQYQVSVTNTSKLCDKWFLVSVTNTSKLCDKWFFKEPKSDIGFFNLKSYAVADLRPRSGLALKHGITVLNSPATIDNLYRKEIGVILYNAGHEPYTITKGDKIAQMLIRPLYPSKMEIVKSIEDTQRGGYGSTGK
jgi:dUTPase